MYVLLEARVLGWVRRLQELGAMDEVHGDENQIRWGLEEVMVGLGRLQQ